MTIIVKQKREKVWPENVTLLSATMDQTTSQSQNEQKGRSKWTQKVGHLPPTSQMFQTKATVKRCDCSAGDGVLFSFFLGKKTLQL